MHGNGSTQREQERTAWDVPWASSSKEAAWGEGRDPLRSPAPTSNLRGPALQEAFELLRTCPQQQIPKAQPLCAPSSQQIPPGPAPHRWDHWRRQCLGPAQTGAHSFLSPPPGLFPGRAHPKPCPKCVQNRRRALFHTGHQLCASSSRRPTRAGSPVRSPEKSLPRVLLNLLNSF